MLKLARAGLIAFALSTAMIAGADTARAVLDNGLTVLAVRSDHAQIAGVGLVIDCSTADEPEGLHGARALLQQALAIESHDRISEQRAPLSALTRPGSSGLQVNTDWDFVEVSFGSVIEELDDGLQLMAEQVYQVELTQEGLDRARELVQRGYDTSHRSPVQTTFDLFRSALYGADPMGQALQGEPAEIAEIELEPLQAFRNEHYVASGSFLCVVAPLPADGIIAAVRRAFEQLPALPAPSEPALPEAPEGSRVEVGESADLVQASMVIGTRLPGYGDPLFPAAEMLAALLEGRGGRLRRDLGLLQGLALAVPTRYLTEHYPVDTLPVPIARRPYLAIHALCAPTAIEVTRQGLMRHLLALRTGTVTDAELERARRRVINAHHLRQERPDQAALYLARRALFGLPDDAAAADLVAAVTKEDLTAVATQYLDRHAIGIQMPAS